MYDSFVFSYFVTVKDWGNYEIYWHRSEEVSVKKETALNKKKEKLR